MYFVICKAPDGGARIQRQYASRADANNYANLLARQLPRYRGFTFYITEVVETVTATVEEKKYDQIFD